MSDDRVAYECLDCPSYSADVEQGERFFYADADHPGQSPQRCPWCGHRAVIEGGVDWDE